MLWICTFCAWYRNRSSFLYFLLLKFNVDDAESLCVCMSVCVSPASVSSETVEVIIIKLGKVTASDMVMHHMFIILTLTFIQGHLDLNHENK